VSARPEPFQTNLSRTGDIKGLWKSVFEADRQPPPILVVHIDVEYRIIVLESTRNFSYTNPLCPPEYIFYVSAAMQQVFP
jgi:hypothetical protein